MVSLAITRTDTAVQAGRRRRCRKDPLGRTHSGMGGKECAEPHGPADAAAGWTLEQVSLGRSEHMVGPTSGWIGSRTGAGGGRATTWPDTIGASPADSRAEDREHHLGGGPRGAWSGTSTNREASRGRARD